MVGVVATSPHLASFCIGLIPAHVAPLVLLLPVCVHSQSLVGSEEEEEVTHAYIFCVTLRRGGGQVQQSEAREHSGSIGIIFIVTS